jgi:hypothetical protein
MSTKKECSIPFKYRQTSSKTSDNAPKMKIPCHLLQNERWLTVIRTEGGGEGGPSALQTKNQYKHPLWFAKDMISDGILLNFNNSFEKEFRWVKNQSCTSERCH